MFFRYKVLLAALSLPLPCTAVIVKKKLPGMDIWSRYMYGILHGIHAGGTGPGSESTPEVI